MTLRVEVDAEPVMRQEERGDRSRGAAPAGGRKEADPAIRDVLGGPHLGDVRSKLEQHMEVVAHHRVAHDRDSKEIGEEMNSILDPLAAMVKVLPGVGIVSTQPSAPHASGDAVVAARQAARGKVYAGAGHGGRIARWTTA